MSDSENEDLVVKRLQLLSDQFDDAICSKLFRNPKCHGPSSVGREIKQTENGPKLFWFGQYDKQILIKNIGACQANTFIPKIKIYIEMATLPTTLSGNLCGYISADLDADSDDDEITQEYEEEDYKFVDMNTPEKFILHITFFDGSKNTYYCKTTLEEILGANIVD